MLGKVFLKWSYNLRIKRFKWLKECDTNSCYFHVFVKSRTRRNVILSLKVKEIWIEGMSDIRQEAVNHFIEIFKEPNVNRPHLNGVVFRSLS